MSKNMKIAIGYEIHDGPWGGGNQVLESLRRHLAGKGAKIVDTLEKDLDLIMIVNPRSGTFSLKELKKYKKRNSKVKIIHRINETDKAKNINKVDKSRLEANNISDAVIFISDWVKNYYIQKGFNENILCTVINNGPNENIFNSCGYIPWNKQEPLKIVTHHWSDNLMKGADIYQQFDELLEDPWMRERFEFTYVGRLPKGINFKNAKLVAPLAGEDLAKELKKHHAYLTGARWESCGMHQLEGALCGLPVLYINEGGGVVETCKDFGIEFTKSNFAVSLFKMLERYSALREKMKSFPFKASVMNHKYEEFISEVCNGVGIG